MKKISRIFSFFMLGIVFSYFFSSCSAPKVDESLSVIKNPKYETFIQDAQDYLKSNSFQGAVLVGYKNQIVYAEGFGCTDPKNSKSPKIDVNTTFEIGSITKQITAALIMQLVEQGKLSLNDKISVYFPEYVHGDEITIEMLLNMRSGLTDYINAGDDYFPRKIYNQIERAQLSNKPVDEGLVLKYFYGAPLLTKPNTTYFYCNTNYYLLACIIEMVTGENYKDYVQKKIFAPCGMNNTNMDFQKTSCKGYDYKGRYYSIPQALSKGCGDVNSSVVDVFRWNCGFYQKKVVNAKSFKTMTNSQSYGFGIYCGPESYFHGGNTNVFNSYDAYYYKDKLSIIVLMNEPLNKNSATTVARNLYKIYKNFNK